MAGEDLIVKEMMIYYAIPMIVVVVVIVFFPKKIKVIRKRFVVWISDKLLTRMHGRIEKQKDVVFSEIKRQANDSKSEGRQLQILEIGCGSGMNFKFFPDGSDLICLDPNPYNKTYLEKNRNKMNPRINLKQFIVGYAENMPEVESLTCDAVVCTLVLCTVRNVDAVLAEVKRVLKPGGVFYYVEHVAAPSGIMRWSQNLFNPLWKICSGGCHLNRETWLTLEKAQFSDLDLSHYKLNMMKLITPLIYGKAVK